MQKKWLRVYIDLEKLEYIRNKSKTKGILDVIESSSINMGIISVPLSNLEKVRKDLLDFAEDIMNKTKKETIAQFVDDLISDKRSSGELVLLEAAKEMEEVYRYISPAGYSFPLLKQGSYFGYRKPFQNLILADGRYHLAYLFDVHEPMGNNDIVKILFKEKEFIKKCLLDSDCLYARILGIIDECPAYNCRVKYKDISEIDKGVSDTTKGVYVVIMDVRQPENIDLVKRQQFWREIGGKLD